MDTNVALQVVVMSTSPRATGAGATVVTRGTGFTVCSAFGGKVVGADGIGMGDTVSRRYGAVVGSGVGGKDCPAAVGGTVGGTGGGIVGEAAGGTMEGAVGGTERGASVSRRGGDVCPGLGGRVGVGGTEVGGKGGGVGVGVTVPVGAGETAAGNSGTHGGEGSWTTQRNQTRKGSDRKTNLVSYFKTFFKGRQLDAALGCLPFVGRSFTTQYYVSISTASFMPCESDGIVNQDNHTAYFLEDKTISKKW